MIGSVCTVVILIRPAHVLLAANRDERIDRVWDPPATWWPKRPGVVAGRDRAAGGTWMGMNRSGVVATVLNRPGTLGPAMGKRSRGDLPLMALEHDTAAAAVEALQSIDATEWRPFNMVVADVTGGWFIRGIGQRHPEIKRLAEGVSMVTALDPNDMESPRTARHLSRFQATEPSDPREWSEWRAILADRSGSPGQQINVVPRAGFGTVCSSYITLTQHEPPLWLFAAGPPHNTEFRPVFCDRDGTATHPASHQAVTSPPPPQAVTNPSPPQAVTHSVPPQAVNPPHRPPAVTS
jgi:hypothetical protein